MRRNRRCAAFQGGLETALGADLDDDGDDELVVSEPGGTTTVYGLAGPGAPLDLPFLWLPAAADVDGDGDEDLVGYNGSIDTIVDGAHHVVVPATAFPDGLSDLAAADLNGDGRAEIVATTGRDTSGGDAVIFDGTTGSTLGSLAGFWDEVEITRGPGFARIWLQRSDGELVDVFDASGGTIRPAGTFTTASHPWWRPSMRALGPALFYVELNRLHLLDTRVGVDTLLPLPLRVLSPAYGIEAIPGGFVVAGLDQAVAYAWPTAAPVP